MKLFIASDIHGSAYYCRKMIKAYREEEAKRMLLLGDLLYHGPRNGLPREYDPKAVIGMLNDLENDVVSVRGNCEAEVDQMVLKFPVTADYAILYAADRMIFATHGHLYNPDRLPPLHQGDILLYGHTHVPAYKELENCVCCNPGSVSLPKEGSPHGYMLLDGGTLFWKTLDGETCRTYRL